jgi:type IV secretory pathway TraG/TraD family ATPase VirD4
MIWLGRSEDQVPLGYRDDRHVCLVGGTRGGKGTTGIIPTILTWPSSLVVVDPKGENATITAARRDGGSPNARGLRQKVMVLDPFSSAQVDQRLRGRFNPLDALDPRNQETIDEAGRIADAIVVMHEDSKDPFWDESARSMIKGLILHILTAPRYKGRRNLITLRKLILRGDWETVQTLDEQGDEHGSAHALLWTGLRRNPAFDGLISGIGDSFRNMLLNSDRQYESVLQVANRNTEFIDSPAMQHLLEASDFQLSELKTRPEGLTLYLSLPQRYMPTHYRWLRMMISLTVTEMEKVRGRPGHPVLLMLDEFAGLKKMEILENAVAQMAGFGVKMFFVLQSLEQLKAVYKDNWETFLANSGLKVFFNLDDLFSRKYVSELIGETEVVREVRSASDSSSQSESLSRSSSQSRSESRGRSSSTGTSENEGTNSSVSTGKSRSVNEGTSKSWAASWGTNWEAGLLWGGATTGGNDGRSITQSKSLGYSHSWNKGQSHGVSHGTSRSRTDGTSDTSGTSTSETEGITSGTSQSRTAGSSETIHKRALVTPDEIGQLFARIEDRAHDAYPGLALAVIAGARPVALRRVNYFEDFQFMGLFDAHPDHPLVGPKVLKVDCASLSKQLVQLNGLLTIGEWSIKPGQMVRAGDPALTMYNAHHQLVANVRIPRGGMVTGISDIKRGPLFTLRYYEDGAAPIDPFSDMGVWRKLERDFIKKDRDDIRRTVEKIAWPMLGVTLLGTLFGAMAWGDGAAGLISFLGLGALLAVIVPRSKKAMRLDGYLKKYFPD